MLGGLLEGARVGLQTRRRREAREVGKLERRLELALLHVGVEADVGRALGLRNDQVVGADQRFDGGFGAGGLVVPLDEVAHGGALDVGGVDPVDPRPAVVGVDRPGAAEHQHRVTAHPGVEHRHRGVQQPHDVVHERGHRLARGASVAVGDRDCDLLVVADDHLRARVAEVVDQRIVHAAKRGAGVQRDVVDAETP